ncbi:monalysin family beta-barrel pore-forming toxin [Pseudomonas putida]|uniref:monalysin family beta-barrel pore-forming toxin n=1 Tax=Pseudomonas putida TaxID=303 RepID=UPI002366C99B|nr:monalysin family beta-barrel pore-forming toxin [Pseudomonas putida]MDD2050116.1 monalysin family beta-barrel pore-forming toxin [Pseudomonas putida]
MSEFTEDRAATYSADDWPLKKGNHTIERHLLAGKHLNLACWVDGQTVYGDVKIAGQAWGTYTRPVFAYLVAVETLNYAAGAPSPLVAFGKGHSKAFRWDVDAEYAVQPAIDRVNKLSNLRTGYIDPVAWGDPGSSSEAVSLAASGSFAVYQVHLVYANCATSAGVALDSAFKVSRQRVVKDRVDLIYLSSIATRQHVAVCNEKALLPLTWQSIQRHVLIDGYEPVLNAGRWAFDFSAYNKVQQRY